MLLNSAKMRLTFWYAGVLAFVLSVFAVVTYLLFFYTLQTQTDETLSEISAVFETTANRELEDDDIREGTKTDEAVRNATNELGFKDHQIFAFSSDKRLIAATGTIDKETTIPAELVETTALSIGPKSKFFDFEFSGKQFRSFAYRFRLEGNEYFVLVFHSLDDQKELLSRIGYAFLISIPLALIAASVGGFFLARKSLEPIGEMSRIAEEITASSLQSRLPVNNQQDELGSLAGKFNNLLSRLEASFEYQRRFMADASHELRTPIAIIRGEADVTLGKENREESEYRDSLTVVQSEAERMTRIIEDLFTLARVDGGQTPVYKEPLYLDDIITESVKAFRTIAMERKVMLELAASDEMSLSADPLLLARLFSNLIDNALKHARSCVTISARVVDDRYEIEIKDDGPGIPKEAQQHIFERFYRADRSRSGHGNEFVGSGAGLGLAISRWIAQSHGGDLSLLSSNNLEGTVFRFILPRTETI